MESLAMDEREISKLWYFADALVKEPENYIKLIEIVKESPIPPSEWLDEALQAICKSIESFGTNKHLSKCDLETIGQSLLQSPGDSIQNAGRAILWALEDIGYL